MSRCANLLLVALLCACAGASPAASAGSSGGELHGELTVFAAASLGDAFADVAQAFEQAHPDVQVVLNLAGSQRLAAQVLQGAPADVLATADDRQMQVVADAGLLRDGPRTFAGNALEIAVEPGNPLGVTTLADLGRDDLVVVLAAPEVPAGRYAARALAGAGIHVSPASLETDVRGVVAKVRLGEADAGVVYRTDIAAADGSVDGIELDAAEQVPIAYLAATLAGAPNPPAAEELLAFLTGPQGQAVLGDHRFTPPP